MLYFKIENHDNTTGEVFNLYQLKYESSTSSYKRSNTDTMINNIWYPIDDYLINNKDTNFTKDDLIHDIVSSGYLQTVVNKETKKDKYDLLYCETYIVNGKKDNAKDGLYFNRAEDITTGIAQGRGYWIKPFDGHTTDGSSIYPYKFNRSDTDLYIIMSVGNRRSAINNDPIVKWNGSSELSFRNWDNIPHRYNQYIDATALPKQSTAFKVYAFKDITKPINIYLNGKLFKTITSAKKDDDLFDISLNANDIVETKYANDKPEPPKEKTQPVHVVYPENITVTPNEIPMSGGKLNIKAKENFEITGYHIWHTDVNRAEDWTLEKQDLHETELNFDVPKFDYQSQISVSVDTQTTLPVYYDLPTIAHVTLNPTKAELGKKTVITATPDSGYIINKLTFYANDPNMGDRIFTSSYNNGSLTLDLTWFDKSDSDLAKQLIKHSESIEQNTPVYYELPTIDHVTFNPSKVEYGKSTNVQATPETGYIINSINFEADNPNTGDTILDTSYKDGFIKFDLTKVKKSQAKFINQLIKHTENVTKLEYGTYVLPKLEGVTFTLGGQPVTSVKLGKYYNFGIKLDPHYQFPYGQDKGQGLVIKNDNGTVTSLGGWNGNTSLGVHLENYTTADQLKNAYWDINVQKFDHSDEHEKQVPILMDLTHATADKTSILENSTDTITLTADNGYIFDDDVIYYSYNMNFGSYDKLTEKANNKNVIKIEISTSSFYDYNETKDNPVDNGEKPYIKAVATSPTVKPTGTQSINLYSMSDGELNTFMNSVLLQFNSTQDGVQTSLANFLDFVNQIYRIPLDIPKKLMNPVTQVHSGKWNINVNTNKIKQDHFSINFEPIKVEPHYKNANDYNSITVSLVIPFAKEVELNINDVMNNSISITYNVDLLQGKTTIIVKNDTGAIYTNQIDISTQLEFYGLYYDKTIGGLNSTYINNVLQPYISINYHKPINNLISYATNEHGQLKDYNGFVRVSHGTLTGNMNDTEYSEIMSLLYGGIKIGTKRN